MKRILADTAAAAFLIDRPQGTIRRWANAGWLTRHGRDERGRTLYDLDEVQALAARIAAGDTPIAHAS